MLKVLKGSRILVDCETGDLHVDLGDGQCKPMGGGGCDLQVVFDESMRNFRLLKGSYSAFVEKLASGTLPSMEILRVEDVENPFNYNTIRVFPVVKIGVTDHGIYFYDEYEGSSGVILTSANVAERFSLD